jgi:hypothetical protein
MKKAIVLTLTIMCLLATTPSSSNHNPALNMTLGGAYATFAGKFGGDLTQKEIDTTTKIGIAGCASGSVILKYTIQFTTGGNKIKLDGESEDLTEEMIDTIKGLVKGDTFVFINMRAKLPTGGKVDVMSRTFTIV